jgi:very-short-patch-repair endonuclease
MAKKHTNESKKKISDSIKKGQASGRIKISENFKREDVVEKRKKSLLEGIKDGKYKKFSNTKPELETKDILNKYGIEFEHQKIVNGKIYDFYLPDYNLLIEVDGNYWHSKGKCDIDILNKSLKNRRNGDRIKNKIALKKGYRLFRVWEDELYKLENLIKK